VFAFFNAGIAVRDGIEGSWHLYGVAVLAATLPSRADLTKLHPDTER